MTVLSNNAMDLLSKRYFRSDEKSWLDLCERVSIGIAQAEKVEDRDKWYFEFLNMMANLEFIPSTPCLINADTIGTGQLSSCFIIDLKDNIESIYQAKSECAKIFQKNGGVGFNISVLRPKNTVVETSKGYSCGTIGFMEEFDLTADVVTRNNVRKGAIKIDLNDWHPDIFDFIHCKDDTTKLQRMNISVSLSDKFMEAVIKDKDWDLIFPDYTWNKEIYNSEWDGDIDKWRDSGYPIKIYKTVKASELYEEIMAAAWKTGEPGVSYRDTMDKNNPNPHLGKVTGTNPCSEFASIPYNSCNLGSINLTKCVIDGKFDWDKFEGLIEKSTRFLDDMITVNKLPIEKIEKITKMVRSVGLGMMGYADALYMLGIKYNSPEGETFMDSLSEFMLKVARNYSMELAIEKGVYPAWEGSEWQKQGTKIRNSNFLSIAPTGSISFIANVSGGVEPNFALVYTRRTNEGDIYYIINEIFENELKSKGLYSKKLLQKIVDNHGSCQGIDEIPQEIQNIFVVSHDISPSEHTKIVAILQKNVDLSISKTVNLLNNATIEDVMNVYKYAWELGVKGITIYRDGSRDNQTLAVKREENKEDISKEDIHKELPRGMIYEVSDDLIGKKTKLMSGCGSLHLQAWFDPTTGDLMEIFLSKGSEGGCNSFMIGLSRMASLAARGGLPIEAIVDQLNSTPTCPSYTVRKVTKRDTSRGNCCPTAIGDALLKLQYEVWDELGILEEEKSTLNSNYKKHQKPTNTITNKKSKCPECEAELLLTEGCITCKSCGWTKC